MQAEAHYGDVVREVRDFLVARAHACEAAASRTIGSPSTPGSGPKKTNV